MVLSLTSAQIVAITNALSPARLMTYTLPVGRGNIDPAAQVKYENYPLELYRWNSEISGAFLTPLEICSVVLRNALSEAIELKYGAKWPWSTGFLQALPNPAKGYSARQDLLYLQGKFTSAGKIIPELKLVFWSQMLTSRHDQRLWDPFLFKAFPYLSTDQTVAQARDTLYMDMEKLRSFRNRIAHHENIFKFPLTSILEVIEGLLAKRCLETANWLHEIQTVTSLIKKKPLLSHFKEVK